MKSRLSAATAAVLILFGCSKAPSPGAGPQATVTLKDGTTFTGVVTKSSISEIALQAPGGETRDYPMTQVASVQYADAAPAPAPAVNPPANAPGANPAPTPPAAPAPAAAAANPPVAPVPEAAPAIPAPTVVQRTIPAGTTLEVRTNQTIDSQTAQPGQRYSAVVARDVRDAGGSLAIPHGSPAVLVVRDASGQGKIQGRSQLVVDVGSVEIAGKRYRLDTSNVVEKGKEGVGVNKRTGEFTGGGAALGGIIGALAGGGKGAAIGALSGAGAGTAAQAVERGKPAHVAAETVMRFQLEKPVTITEMR